MKIFLKIFVFFFLITGFSYLALSEEKNFRQRDAEWRASESSPDNEFKKSDKEWLKKDAENTGWRSQDVSWRQNDSKSGNRWRSRDKAWLKEDSR